MEEEDAGSIISSMCALSLFDDNVERSADTVQVEDTCILCETPEHETPVSKQIPMSQSPTSVRIGSKALTNRIITHVAPPTPDDFKSAGKAVKSRLFYKTSWCVQQQRCPYHHKCRFCHPGELLRPRPNKSVVDHEIFLYAWGLALKRARGYVQ